MIITTRGLTSLRQLRAPAILFVEVQLTSAQHGGLRVRSGCVVAILSLAFPRPRHALDSSFVARSTRNASAAISGQIRQMHRSLRTKALTRSRRVAYNGGSNRTLQCRRSPL